MDSFLVALQFLTILPLKIKEVSEQKIRDSMILFPVVGLFLGLLLAGINWILLTLNFSLFVSSTILTIVLIVITGGLHLDGLSDTADALLSRKPKEEMLAIMRDPHIGVMGALSLISTILLKIGLLYSVSASLKTCALLLACVLSRWSAVLVMFLFDYARQDGKAKVYMQEMNLRIILSSLATVIVLAFAICRLKGLYALLIVSGCAYLGARFTSRKIGGITGDTLGATIELTEVVTLFTLCVS